MFYLPSQHNVVGKKYGKSIRPIGNCVHSEFATKGNSSEVINPQRPLVRIHGFEGDCFMEKISLENLLI